MSPSPTSTAPNAGAPSAAGASVAGTVMPVKTGRELSAAEVRLTTLHQALTKPQMQQALIAALPRVGLTPERMVRLVMTAVQRTPDLLECEPHSIVRCVLISAQLGLDPSGVTGEAYILPFHNGKTQRKEAQFIPGYRGLLQLVRRSEQVSTFMAQVVYEKDTFEFAYGIETKLVHVPASSGPRGKPTHAYAAAKFKDGGVAFEVMTVSDIEEVRSSSKASKSGPWVTHWDAMARKTVARRLCKWLPMSVDAALAVNLAGDEEAGLAQDLGVFQPDYTVIESEPAKPPLDALTDRLQGSGESGSGAVSTPEPGANG